MNPLPATGGKFHYAAYHLAIRSEIVLPELLESSHGGDLEIRLAPSVEPVERRSIDWREEPAEVRFNYPGLARFILRAGREILITPDPRGDTTLLHLYVEGMMLAAALYQRGRFVLHASVVNLGGRAIAFMGPVGAGKSTLAAAFHSLGYRILADDNAVLDLDAGRPRVLPAFPSLKIYPAVARSLGMDAGLLRPMHVSQVKQAHRLVEGFSAAPLPLAAIYVLDRAAERPLERMRPVAGLTEIIRHSVPTRWGVAGDARHLRLCGRLAGMVPLFRTRTFRELGQIPEIAGEIESHVAQQADPLFDPAGACA
jgi:hypothetical protein